MVIIGLILIGLVAGLIARFLVPGRDPIGLVGTILLGIVGSFVGGFLFSALGDGDGALQASGLLGSVIGAVIVLLLYNAVTRRGGSRRAGLLR